MLAPIVDQQDLQGGVLASYGNDFAHALYSFVRIGNAASGRRWLSERVGEVTNAVPWGEDDEHPHTLNLALSHDGLRALGVPEPMLATFPDEFREGMAARAYLLGDTGPSAPSEWDPGLRASEPHVLVSVFARKRDVLVRRRDEVRDSLEPDPGLELVHEIEAALLDHPAEGAFAREHFGFADGLSQPTIAGNAGPYSRPGGGTPTEEGGWKDVAPGEFVLGYLDEDGVTSDQPAEPLRQSGSFLVVRKLHQDVALFTRYLKDAAKGDPAREELLAAKIVGRWRDGTPLVLSPNRPDPALATDRGEGGRINDFRYDADPGGRRCPLGAHIRRANPRDALGWNGALTKRHRIIRRGMPYGVQPADRAVDDGQDRGLMFVCYQASISRQFEAIQAHWLNDGNPFGLGSDRDFLVENEDPRGKMTIQGEPPTFLSPQRSFVTTKGGGYFFTPGVRALRTLAAGDWL